MASQHETQKGRSSAKPTSKILVWKKNLPDVEPRRWSNVDGTTIRLCIDAVTANGGAIMFGVTSDGGAYSLCILHGNEKLKEYPHTPDEAEELLRQIAESFLDI